MRSLIPPGVPDEDRGGLRATALYCTNCDALDPVTFATWSHTSRTNYHFRLINRSGFPWVPSLDFPEPHRSKLHSTNPLERLNKEVKRRAPDFAYGYLPYGGYYVSHRGDHGFAHGMGGGFNHGVSFAHAGGFHGGGFGGGGHR